MEKQNRTLAQAKQALLRLLNLRPRSEHEIREKLNKKNFPAPVIDEALQYFKALDLINDLDFAKKWTAYRLLKPFGVNRIRLELKEKGIAKNIIDDVLSLASEEVDEEAQIKSIMDRRAPKYQGLDKEKAKQRLYNYILRRGFNPQAVYKVIKKYDSK